MSKRIFIRLRGRQSAEWLRQSDAGNQYGHGSLADAAAVATGLQLIVIVPGEDVLLARAHVPGHKRRYLGQMVPYAMEEQLIGDIDDSHFAFGDSDGEHVSVAVVSRRCMEIWNELLAAHNLHPKHLVVDTQLLPLAEGHWHGLLRDSQLLLSDGARLGQVIDLDNLDSLLPMWLAEQETPPVRLSLHHCGATPALTLPTVEGCELRLEAEVDSIVGYLAKQFDSAAPINLLQGDYSRRERSSRLWRPWKPALALAAGWLLLSFTTALVDSYRLQGELEALRADVKQIYMDTFPDSKNVPKPKEMMERQLRALSGGGSDDANFIALLDKAATQLSATRGLDLHQVNFKDGKLDIAFNIGDLQQLDQLKQQLIEKGGLTVDVRSAAAQGSQVEARLRISGGAS